MPRLRLFGPAREAAGTATCVVSGRCVGQVIEEAQQRFGEQLSSVMGYSRIWVNGDEAQPDTPVGEDDEIAIIPPVSGGCR
jgi:sulfur-carrier protein